MFSSSNVPFSQLDSVTGSKGKQLCLEYSDCSAGVITGKKVVFSGAFSHEAIVSCGRETFSEDTDAGGGVASISKT